MPFAKGQASSDSGGRQRQRQQVPPPALGGADEGGSEGVTLDGQRGPVFMQIGLTLDKLLESISESSSACRDMRSALESL